MLLVSMPNRFKFALFSTLAPDEVEIVPGQAIGLSQAEIPLTIFGGIL